MSIRTNLNHLDRLSALLEGARPQIELLGNAEPWPPTASGLRLWLLLRGRAQVRSGADERELSAPALWLGGDTAGLARAYAGDGVRVNGVNPGMTETERLFKGLTVEARQEGISLAEARQRAGQRLPLGRIATPDEIANAVLFLASSKASYISGAIVAMDGALTPMVV